MVSCGCIKQSLAMCCTCAIEAVWQLASHEARAEQAGTSTGMMCILHLLSTPLL